LIQHSEIVYLLAKKNESCTVAEFYQSILRQKCPGPPPPHTSSYGAHTRSYEVIRTRSYVRGHTYEVIRGHIRAHTSSYEAIRGHTELIRVHTRSYELKRGHARSYGAHTRSYEVIRSSYEVIRSSYEVIRGPTRSYGAHTRSYGAHTRSYERECRMRDFRPFHVKHEMEPTKDGVKQVWHQRVVQADFALCIHV
jgi:hypothetical protein